MRVWVLSLLAQAVVLLVFFILYSVFYYAGVAKFNKDKMDLMDLMHYSVICQSSIGFGDLFPTSNIARVISWLHAIMTIVVIAYTTLGE